MSSKKKNWISFFIFIVVCAISYIIYQNNHIVSENYEYYVSYPDIHQLLPSSPVFLKGVKVGQVSEIKYKGQEDILVTMSIDKRIPLQEKTIAQLSATSLQGSRIINLLVDSSQTKTLPHKSILTPQYDTTLIETSLLINPMIASAKYYVRTLNNSLEDMNRQLRMGVDKDIKRDIATLRKNLLVFANNTSILTSDADDFLEKVYNLRHSSTAIVNDIDSTNYNIKQVNNTLKKLSKTTIKKDLKELSENLKNISSSIAKGKSNKNIDKLLSDKNAYSSSVLSIDTLHQKVEKFKSNPKPITILGGN